MMQRRYIVFDGDVDAVWVENMNSVMDDNKLLTLPNGERIRVQNHCKLLFEVFDLQYASPATISRCGMVYVDSCNLGYQPFVWTWLTARADEEEREMLRGLFDKYSKPCVDWILEGVEGSEIVRRPERAIPVTNLNMISQLTTLLEIQLGASGTIKDTQVCICAETHGCCEKEDTLLSSLAGCQSMYRVSAIWHMQNRGDCCSHVAGVLLSAMLLTKTDQCMFYIYASKCDLMP
jgi:hypothetical protein